MDRDFEGFVPPEFGFQGNFLEKMEAVNQALDRAASGLERRKMLEAQHRLLAEARDQDLAAWALKDREKTATGLAGRLKDLWHERKMYQQHLGFSPESIPEIPPMPYFEDLAAQLQQGKAGQPAASLAQEAREYLEDVDEKKFWKDLSKAQGKSPN
jgi:hypothetical protein